MINMKFVIILTFVKVAIENQHGSVTSEATLTLRGKKLAVKCSVLTVFCW